jgi:hypothetical protein
MVHETKIGLTLSALVFSCLALGACGAAAPEPDPATPQPSPADPSAAVDDGDSYALDQDVSANTCRKPPQSCSSSKKCCSGAVCLNDDLSPDPAGGPLTCHPCGKLDQLCCGTKRAQSLGALEKRCSQKRTVCPQGESSDFCEACGDKFQSCCIEKGKAVCHDGSTCMRTIAGGPGRDAAPGMCL